MDPCLGHRRSHSPAPKIHPSISTLPSAACCQCPSRNSGGYRKWVLQYIEARNASLRFLPNAGMDPLPRTMPRLQSAKTQTMLELPFLLWSWAAALLLNSKLYCQCTLRHQGKKEFYSSTPVPLLLSSAFLLYPQRCLISTAAQQDCGL